MSYLVNPYMVEAASTTLWDQTSENSEFLFNNYVTSAAISPIAGAGIIGRTLRTFTLTLAYNTTPFDAPVTFGVWAVANVNRTSPTTEFECTSHTLTNFNQLTAGYITYTFEVKAPATSHTLVALDAIGYCYNTRPMAGAFQKQKRSNYSSTAPEMSSSIYYNTSPTPQWLGNDVNQCPTSFGSSA